MVLYVYKIGRTHRFVASPRRFYVYTGEEMGIQNEIFKRKVTMCMIRVTLFFFNFLLSRVTAARYISLQLPW